MAIEFDLGPYKGTDCVLTLDPPANEIMIEFFSPRLCEETRCALNKARIFYDSPDDLYVRIQGRHQGMSLDQLAEILAKGIEADGYDVTRRSTNEGADLKSFVSPPNWGCHQADEDRKMKAYYDK